MIRVMIVDNHPLAWDGIAGLLAKLPDIKIVGKANSGEGAVNLASEQKPDVILMKIDLPGMDGIQATDQVIDLDPDIKIIGMSVDLDQPVLNSFLRAGGKGYLSKGAGLEKMAKAIHTVIAGEIYLEPELTEPLTLNEI